MRHPVTMLLAALAVGSLTSTLSAENWPQWRGPNGDGTTSETGLATKWSKTENVVWRLPLPGPSGATPAVWGGDIFLTSVDEKNKRVLLLRVSTAGKIQWTREVGPGGHSTSREDEGNSSAPSPITDGELVWVFTGAGDLACFDYQGQRVWKTNLQEKYGKFDHWHGMSTTPLLVDSMLYQMCLQMERPYIVAFDKKTGDVRWRRPRTSDADHESRHSYASPVLYRDGDTQQLLIHGADYLSSHNLGTGEEIWRCGPVNRRDYDRFLRFVASPVAIPGMVIMPSAKNYSVLAIRPDGEGDVTKSHLIWRRPQGTPDVPTPVVHEGLVYLLREKGTMICVDAKTGDEVYEARIHGGRQRASPIIADGKLYCAARNGTVHVIRPGRKFEVLARNEMGESLAATPAISGGRIYLRTYDALYAVSTSQAGGQ